MVSATVLALCFSWSDASVALRLASALVTNLLRGSKSARRAARGIFPWE